MKKISLLVFLLILCTSFSSCMMAGQLLNGTALTEYAIVYSDEDLDYSLRAAEYIQAQIKDRTGIQLPIQEDSSVTAKYEIVVGQTEREVSQLLDEDTQGTDFALLAHGNQIGLEGDYFVIAAAAHYFIETYIPGQVFQTAVPTTATVCQPIVKDPNNFILLIGDGMGPNQTKLFEEMDSKNVEYSDGESLFYGYLFPYSGFSRTDNAFGTVTDSAAGGTALSTGYKTRNGYVGKDKTGVDIPSLTEMALLQGKSTAVMSTETPTGATPASFSAHTTSRENRTGIAAGQAVLAQKGCVIRCEYNVYDSEGIENNVEKAVTETLEQVSANEKGFFLMYEEAHIDKHSHNRDKTNTFRAVTRFNQAIGRFMEFAFYHPDTMVIITADHETGKLLPNNSGGYSYNSGDHSGADVPVFAYGKGADCFDGKTYENAQIAKTIAKFWGLDTFGDPTGQPALF
ncbi:MAG: alkaline phosphatase [Oscillospiraceae bacterium]|nr:alkaline phosphatase [Oscillospiraceae bacterium]